MPYLSLKVQAERFIVPFTEPKGQQSKVIGHFWEGYRILLRASSPLSTTKATKASKTLLISAATKATIQPLMRLMRSLVIFPHLQPLSITRQRLVAGENNLITRQRFGVRGHKTTPRRQQPSRLLGAGLGLGFCTKPKFSGRNRYATAMGSFFSLSPKPFFAYFRSLTPRIFA